MPVAPPDKAYAEVYNPRTMKWNLDKLASLTREDWREWIRDRLHGDDDVHGYGREEYPDHSAALFASVAAVCRKAHVDMENARRGAAQALEDISTCDENPDVIANAMYALRHFSEPERDDGAETVAQWIRRGALVKREDGHDLQRVALASLAVLQELQGGRYHELWQEYFCKKRDPNLPTPFFYVATAFAGKVLDAKEPPVDDVVRLLDLYEESGEFVPASNALLPYWRLWGEQRHMKALAKRFDGLGDKAEERWSKLTVLSKRWRSLPSWAMARDAYLSKSLGKPRGSGSSWGCAQELTALLERGELPGSGSPWGSRPRRAA